MRIVYLGDFAGRPDEGMRALSQGIVERMERRHEILAFNTRAALSKSALAALRRFRPHVVHYLTGPTLRSLLILGTYGHLMPGCATIASAPRPYLPPRSYRLVRALRPSLILTQDPRWETLFARHGATVRFVPNGVDLARFRPVSRERKQALQREFRLPAGKPLVFHAGHLKANRNLELLAELQRTGAWQVVIAASPAMPPDQEVVSALEASGCLLLRRYVPNMEDLYACADYYIFPVRLPARAALPRSYNQVGVIDMPLSVLEAMAVNLPIVSAPFPALRRLFAEDSSLRWFDGTVHDCVHQIERIDPAHVANRDRVEPVGWPRIIEQLECIYRDLCRQN